jgi:isoleucyl-tRNA synthetase
VRGIIVRSRSCFISLYDWQFTQRALQTPLKELLVFHADEGYLEDVKSLQRYLQSELNVRDLIFTSDETTSGLRYRAAADWGVLGKKLRKDLGRVKNALPNVPSDDIKAFVNSGKLTVDGIELVAGDLTVQRYIDLPRSSQQYGTHTDNDVVIRLDLVAYPELMGEWLAREFINRIQKLRKKAGLQATDDVEIYFSVEEEGAEELTAAMSEYVDSIKKTVGSKPVDEKERPKDIPVIIEEEHEVAGRKILLRLVRPRGAATV